MKWLYTTAQFNYCSWSFPSLVHYLGKLLFDLLWLQEAQKIPMYDGHVELKYFICVRFVFVRIASSEINALLAWYSFP